MRGTLPIERILRGALLFGLYAVPLTVAWTVAGVHLAVGLAAIAGIGLGLRTGRWPVRPTPADRGMLAFALACALAALASPERAASLVATKKLLLLPLVHLAAALPAGRGRTALRLYVGTLAVAGAVASLHHLLVPHPPGLRLRLVGHYMTFAGLLLLALPLAVAAASTATRRSTRALYAAAAAALAGTLLLGFSRSAWLGALAGLSAMLLRARPRLALAVPLLAALAFAASPPAYRDRARSSFDLRHPLNAERLRLWRAGVEVWRERPWTGVGLVDLAPHLARHLDPPTVHGHVHDNWLQIAATTGTAGLLAFLWLMVGCGRLARRASRAADGEQRGLGMGVWGAFWGFQTMGLFEWNFGDVEVTIALYYLLGAGLAVSAAGAEPRGAETSATEERVSA